MIKADELWVGDWLRVMASGQRGRFEKQDPGGKMVLRMKDDRLISFNSEELEISQDEDIPESIEYKRSSEDARRRIRRALRCQRQRKEHDATPAFR